ncbi:MAG TPA: hypothetical protein ENG83_11140 [Nitrospirae bacterium]|nr:putative lipoprotein YbbD precursor [bacterium BMS3Abin06]HDH12728.1 hypothetical protein [Nitrospirota bacterium]HDZ00037.1 hypothetical protein [Nitrospirota bacterium]
MSGLEQKLWQLIISRLDGEKLSSIQYQERASELVRKGIGGFILFGGKRNEVKTFINKLQSVSETPLFIASDIERGVGQQIDGATHFPCQMAVAAAINKNNSSDVEILEDVINAVSHEAIDIGINMPLIPVMDVNRNPDNPIICTRAFSDNQENVSWYGKTYIKTIEDAGLISCAKHFPGHGDTAIDSHIALPVISKSFDELMNTDIFPFREAVKAGAGSIMTGHLSIPAIDELPASLSKKVITGLLRTDLGYEGLVLTDALNMHALNEYENVPAMCINAGGDILLHPADADSVVEELKQAVASGKIDEGTIDTAVERILKYKSKIKNIRKSGINYQEHAGLSERISDKSVTLVKDSPGVLPIKNTQGLSLAFAADENKHDLSTLKNFISGHIRIKDSEKESLRKTVVFALFTSIAAWGGSSGIRDDEINIIRKLIKNSRNSIVISFGSPYVLGHFPKADLLIAAYDTSKQAQVSVIKCLKGERNFKGSLPVKLPF